MAFSRKQFVSLTALGVSAAALGADRKADAASDQRAPVHFRVLKPGQYDRALMMKKLGVNKANKQVFQSVSPLVVAPGVASVYIHMQNSMNAYQFSFDQGAGSLATLAVFIGPSIVLGLNDAMWRKYRFGDALKLAQTNIYYRATSNLNASASPDDPNGMYQDWSAQAVAKRGGSFMVCHNATSAIAAMFAGKSGRSANSVLADFERNLLPEFQMVPAGVAAVQMAQDHGWQLYPII